MKAQIHGVRVGRAPRRSATRQGRALRLVISILALLASGLAGLVATAPAASAAAQNCDFADAGSGTFASTLCWFDLSGYNAAQATSPAGQQLTIDLPNGYSIAFTLNVTGGAVKAATLPTFSDAFLGNFGYTGIAGDPALYQTTSGTTTTATMSAITMTNSGGATVTGYSLVGADAESTDNNESLTWTSSSAITSLSPIGNACGGGFTGVGTMSVTCTGTSVGHKTGAAILASDAPTTFTQKMKGGGLEGFAFGVLVSRVELDKTVVNGFSGDSFAISAANSSGTVVGSANTAGGTSASTGQITVLTNSMGEQFTFSEAATAGTLADYTQSWSCTRNGATDPSLPSGAAGTSATVAIQVGDFVDCGITNTAKAASLSLTKHAATPVDINNDGLTDAGDTIAYSFDVKNTGVLEIDGVGITDPTAGSVTCPQPSLAAGDSETCTADSPYTITAADVTAGSVQNTATASGNVVASAGMITSPPSSTTTPTTAPAPALTITKSVLPTSAMSAGQTVTYSFLITNTGNVTINAVSVDELSFTGSGSMSALSCPAGAAAIVPSASVTCTATYDVTQADIDAGSVSNTADATGTDPANDVITSPPSSATVSTTASPALTVVKSASPSGAQAFHAGDTITYSFVVTNTGNVTITDIAVDEGAFTGTGTLSPATCPAGAASLAPGTQVTCTATYVVTQTDVNTGTLTNTATATGTPPAGVQGPITSPPSTVVLPEAPAAALSIMKSATPANMSTVGQTITYSFLVTNTGNVTITGAAIMDTAFTGSGQLSPIDCPASVIALVPAAQVTCTATYVVTQQDLDAGTLSNTAVVFGLDPAGGLITSPPATAKVGSTAPSKLGLRKTAHAIDVNHDGVTDQGDRIDWSLVATNLGATTITHVHISDPSTGKVTCPATVLAPGAHMSCTVASHDVTAADVTAGKVENTARATGLVMHTVPLSSVPAHASVNVHPTPGPKTVLPFTGFTLTLPLTAGGVALVLLGALMLTAAATLRRRSV